MTTTQQEIKAISNLIIVNIEKINLLLKERYFRNLLEPDSEIRKFSDWLQQSKHIMESYTSQVPEESACEYFGEMIDKLRLLEEDINSELKDNDNEFRSIIQEIEELVEEYLVCSVGNHQLLKVA